MASKPNPTVEQLRQLLRYDPEIGTLYWLPRGPEWFRSGYRTAAQIALGWNRKWAGKPALDCISGEYRKGTVLLKQLMAHRAAYALTFGIELIDLVEIDHINGCKTDNRLANLRHVDHSQNARNVCLYSTNTSGFHGVMWDKSHKAWSAKINYQGKQRRIGRFKSFQDAVEARKLAEIEHGYHANHGRSA